MFNWFNKKYSEDELPQEERQSLRTNTPTPMSEVEEPKQLDISEPCYAIAKSLEEQPERWINWKREYKHIECVGFITTLEVEDSFNKFKFKVDEYYYNREKGYFYSVIIDDIRIFNQDEGKYLYDKMFKAFIMNISNGYKKKKEVILENYQTQS